MKWMKFIRGYMMLSCFVLFALLGSVWLVRLFYALQAPLDWYLLIFLVGNFSVGAVVCQFWYCHLTITRLQLLMSGIMLAWWFLMLLPAWTVWSLLVLLVVFDIIVVLLPFFAPLKEIVQTARERGEPIPAPVYPGDEGLLLGMGDFVFYSVLTGRSFLSGGYICSFASATGILSGLCLTLGLLRRLRMPLPALPISILFGIFSHMIAQGLVVPFAVWQLSTGGIHPSLLHVLTE
jgi:presenilin 1